MVWLFPKEQEGRLSANFALRELRCGCPERSCHHTLVHPKLVETLQTLREILARPLVLTSGFRCKTHNERVGGRLRSFHTQGMAADIACPSYEDLAELAETARRVPAVGAIGSYPAKGYLHLDIRRRAANGGIVEWSL
jgi:uncharacterized protein YcbK (DUF882 family)